MTEEELAGLDVGDELSGHGETAVIEAIDRDRESAVLHVDAPKVDPDAIAKIPVAFAGLLSDWEVAK